MRWSDAADLCGTVWATADEAAAIARHLEHDGWRVIRHSSGHIRCGLAVVATVHDPETWESPGEILHTIERGSMCSCDCVRVGRRYQVLDDLVVVEGEAGPTADGLWLATMHPTSTSGEVEIRGWRHRRGQPDPDWWTCVVRVDALPNELRALAP